MVRISNELAGLEQCAGASPLSIALTVLEIQLTKVKVSGASSYELLFAKGVNFGSSYISRMVSAMSSGDGSAYCSRPTDLFDVHIMRILAASGKRF